MALTDYIDLGDPEVAKIVFGDAPLQSESFAQWIQIKEGNKDMAVTIKKKALTIKSLAKRLFESDDSAGALLTMASALENNGYKLTTAPTVIKIEDAHAVLAEANVKLSAIQSAIKGNLSYVGKKALKAHIKGFIEKAYNLMPNAVEQTNLSDIYDDVMAKYHENGTSHPGGKVAAIKLYRSLTGASLKEAKDQVEDWIYALVKVAPSATDNDEKYEPGISLGKADPNIGTAAFGDKPISLTAATKLLQPIVGTSTGSVYHVVAIGPDAKVAVRIRNDNEVAIRAVASNNKGEAAFKAAGLDKKGGGHYSLHLTPGSKPLVSKSIGAVLFAMGLEWGGLVGNMNSLIGVGK